jgi:hypothetical protein
MASVVGKATACVLFVTVGDPRNFPCGAAYRKAMGLNLKERSSGKFQGQLRITKRGSSAARRWLYFAALRLIMRSSVRSWFEAKKRKDSGRGQAAVVGVMRKMALAVHVVATRNETFYASRLFPGRPLPSRAAREAAPVAEVADAGAWDLTREGKDQNTSPGTGAAGSST